MAKRGASSGSGKRASRQRGPRMDTPAFQRRIDRQHGGPPSHIAAKQQLELAKRLERKRIAAETAARALAPASDIIIPSAIVAPTLATAPIIAPPRLTSVPTVARSLSALQPPPSARRGPAWPRLAAVLLLVPLAAAVVALVTPASPPVPGITAPTRIADAPLLSTHAIERRIVEMTPAVSLAAPAPALPGSIRFAALRLPSDAPDVPAIAPALVPPPPILTAPKIFAPEVVAPSPAPVEVVIASPPPPGTEHQCTRAPVQTTAFETPPREAMGAAVAAAALKQTTQFVVYNARYTRIAYPGGDVSSLEGVCTDVIIRAYRALGIDLQRLVHESRIGSGDTSIDHRRTETLRKFLSIYGESLPVSEFVENFQPGDIVTYYRPQNRTSTAHIAVVADVIAPSGRPMIIHNRGLGVQLEDALFVDKITGHYRYAGPPAGMPASTIVAVSRLQTSALPSRVGLSTRTAVTQPLPVRAAAKSPAAAKLALRAQSAAVNPPAALNPRP